MNKKIINETEILLYNKKYKEITYDNGETILRRFEEKSKMWINLKFKSDYFDDTKNIEKIKEITKNVLLNTIHT